MLGLRSSTLPQSGRCVGAPVVSGPRSLVVTSAVKHAGGEAVRHSDSRYEPCEPSSSSSLADFGTRVTLERLYCATNGMDVAQPLLLGVTVDDRPQRTRNQDREKDPDYFANVGDAIRSLREDIPMLFQRELNCECATVTLPGACACLGGR